MAQFEHLPIYKKAYDLALYFENIVRNFSRYHKYTVGTELRQLSREVLRLIRRANNSFNKAPILEQLRERLEDLKLTIRLCKDFHERAWMNRVCPSLHTRLCCLSGLCRPYGAKTTGVSFCPPLTQRATVVTPRWGVFVMPR